VGESVVAAPLPAILRMAGYHEPTSCVTPRMLGTRGSVIVISMDPNCAEDLPFENRAAAGAVLGRRLFGIHWPTPGIVLALPRGGVPVGKSVAKALHLPLDVLVVRKVGHPDQPEFAIGAVAAGGVTIRNPRIATDISPSRFEALAATQRIEVNKRERRYRGGRPPLSLDGKTVILVDDGLATGATMRAALSAARIMGAAFLVAAVPVGSREAVEHLGGYADEVVCLYTPEPFQSVGMYYADFRQLKDSEVGDALAA
jgi:putative phosphoribosyl transferase